MKHLHNLYFNISVTVITTVVCFYLYHKSGVLENVGMAAIVLNWLPIAIGLITLFFYLITRLITKKYGWILTLLGVLINVMLVISAYWA